MAHTLLLFSVESVINPSERERESKGSGKKEKKKQTNKQTKNKLKKDIKKQTHRKHNTSTITKTGEIKR